MNERLEKKIRKYLAKAGLSEDKVNDIVDDVNEEVAEGVGEENKGNPAENASVPPVVEGEDEDGDTDDEEGGDVVPPVVEGDLPQETPSEVPPVVNPEDDPTAIVPPTPTIDPNQFAQVVTDLEESNKAIQGLLARIDSLESALRDSGVITSQSAIGGNENPIVPPSGNRVPNPMDDVLAQINPKRNY